MPQKTDDTEKLASVQAPIINDFTITFGTVNGSGSATANTTLMRALFRMGIPVSGKNIFPSNIQGLPTWYSLRLSKNGYFGRVEKDDIVVAMNPATFAKEMDYIVPGGVLFYADDISLQVTRDDIVCYPMPIRKLIKEAEVPPNLRDYIANMVYVGILAEMIGIDQKAISEALDFHFRGSEKAIKLNYDVILSAANWAKNNLEKKDRYFVEPMPGTDGYIMSDGNTAAAIGALYGGVQFAAWYPITPATSLAEALHEYLPILRIDPETKKQTSVIVQAEDELAAAGMVIGAGWAGLRSMTSTSGPGLSLMAEYIGLAYFAEVPIVIWDVQRVGPSTGLPTRTAQGDILFANFIGHGDTQYILLFPGSVNECYEFGWKAFDIAERWQTPVIVLSDLDLGMNQWITPKFEYPDQPMDRGKILWEADLEKILERTKGKFGRYMDIDGDYIPYRTLMGNKLPKSAYFARGTGHDEYANYSEEPEIWEANMLRLKNKLEAAKNDLPKPEIFMAEGAHVGIIASGSAHFSVVEARDLLAKQGIATDYMRIRALPFADDVREFVREHEKIYVVELNRDGQLRQLIDLAYPDCVMHIHQVSKSDGYPLSARWIVEQILSKEEE
ncbi:MAG: 2-oxoacid:acceptor oxidoreductase subunit alpha [Anaerolineaceae bacterium]